MAKAKWCCIPRKRKMEVERQCSTDCEELGITRDIPRYPNFAVLERRLDSYRNWPISAQAAPVRLAEAGFVYTGTDDSVRCFYCSGGLSRWRTGDNPWVEHANFYPSCPFLSLVKGKDFVDRIKGATQTDGAREEISLQATCADHLSSTAARSCLQMGFAKDRVQNAVQFYIEMNGSDDFNGEELLDILLSGQDSQTDTASVTENTHSTSTDETKSNTSRVHDNTSEEITETLEELYEENSRLKESHVCKICLDGSASIVFLPCYHMVTCPLCAPAFTKCPMCRKAIGGFVKAYFSAS